jgi:hypothetical protein
MTALDLDDPLAVKRRSQANRKARLDTLPADPPPSPAEGKRRPGARRHS